MAQKIQSLVLDLLRCKRRREFGFDIMLKDDAKDALMSISSMHPQADGLATIAMIKPHDGSLIDTIRALDLTVCNVDSTRKHVHMCGTDKERELFHLEVQYSVSRLRTAWHAAEYERYQQRRVEMGLRRLADGEKRSHWDEGMRLAYLKRFGGTAYQTQRVLDMEGQRSDFEKIDADALAEAEGRRSELLRLITDGGLSSITVTYLHSGEPVFSAVLLTLLHFFLLDCEMDGLQISDLTSGIACKFNSGSKKLVTCPADVACIREGLLPRNPVRVAAQQSRRNLENAEAASRLLAFGLSDAQVEDATRRFYSGKTFLQYVLNSKLRNNSRAVEYACFADINGAIGDESSRPVLFVLVQVLLNVSLEFENEHLSREAIDLKDFFTALWTSYTTASVESVDNKSYLWKGLTLIEYSKMLSSLLADTLSKEDGIFLLGWFQT